MSRRAGRGVLHRIHNHVQDVVWPLFESAVPDPQHAIATRCEPTGPDFVVVHLFVFRMLAAVQTCKAQGYNVSAHVLGRSGEVLVAMRGDDTGPHTLENSMKKAWTARAQRAPSLNFANAVKANPTAGAIHLTNMVPAQGGLPIMVGDDAIGAVGVSGAPGGDKDEACAKAGLDKVASDLK